MTEFTIPADSAHLVASSGMVVNEDGCDADSIAYCGGVLVTVAAGENWDEFVDTAVSREWVGVEALAGLPGTVGQVVALNPHVYGQSPGDTVAGVKVWDRHLQRHTYLAMVDVEFDDDGSLLSHTRMEDGSVRYVPLEVTFQFRQGHLSDPIDDDELAARMKVDAGKRAPLLDVMAQVRAANPLLRRP